MGCGKKGLIMNPSKYIYLRIFTFNVMTLISILFLVGCAEAPVKNNISEASNDYLVIIKGESTLVSQKIVKSLKNEGVISAVESIELNDNHSEYRVWSHKASGDVYDGVITVLDKLKLRNKVSYSADKFTIRRR